jgi:hypothetical protein
VLAEHLVESSLVHRTVDGLPDLLSAKVLAGPGRCGGGQSVGLLPDARWASAFVPDGRLLS